jgi:hypothetical protein
MSVNAAGPPLTLPSVSRTKKAPYGVCSGRDSAPGTLPGLITWHSLSVLVCLSGKWPRFGQGVR